MFLNEYMWLLKLRWNWNAVYMSSGVEAKGEEEVI